MLTLLFFFKAYEYGEPYGLTTIGEMDEVATGGCILKHAPIQHDGELVSTHLCLHRDKHCSLGNNWCFN